MCNANCILLEIWTVFSILNHNMNNGTFWLKCLNTTVLVLVSKISVVLAIVYSYLCMYRVFENVIQANLDINI